MSVIKNIFKKLKKEAKFKTAGEGHKLNETKAPPKVSVSKKDSVSRMEPTESSSRAGAAALQRFEQQQHSRDPFSNRSKAAIRAEVKKELMAEKVGEQTSYQKMVVADVSSHFTVKGVFFKCPLITDQVLPKEEMRECIRVFLYEQMAEEPGLTACLMIHSFNRDKEKVKLGIETLCTYLDNIANNPTEEKFRRIRLSNRAFQMRVACLEGAVEFILAAGFVRRKLPVADGGEEEEFYVFPEENLNQLEQLGVLRDALVTAEPIQPELDRNVRVFLPSSAPTSMDLPPDFFNITADELKGEQKARTEDLEKIQMLRTKAMRERDEQREMKKYKYSLLRIRFPDGYILQGTFSVYERLSAVAEFVREYFRFDWLPFTFRSPTGHALDDEEANLLTLQLVPAAVVTCEPSQDMQEDLKAQCGGAGINYLNTESMALAQQL